jgi:regulator of PEP synthase PpsR (kinase-PPPase family)
MAQFPHSEILVEVFPKVFNCEQVEKIFAEAIAEDAVVTHTFVDPKLREFTKNIAADVNLPSIDLVGPLMENLGNKLNQIPMGKPGLYRQLYRSYYDRISAMDYGLEHDDGKNPEGWSDAEIVLLGASRVGKTPISLYLSVLGWKVANIPLVAGIMPREELALLDKRRLVGLTIAASELIEYRKHRQRSLGVGGMRSDYIDPSKVFEEIETIEDFLRRRQISIIDVTGKPIETTADEIIRLLKRKII